MRGFGDGRLSKAAEDLVATMSETDAREAFTTARVARLATVAGPEGRPHLVPVTFVVDDGAVYFAVDAKPKSTRRLRRLRNIEENPHVCLLVDEYAQDWENLWWARADGVAREVDADVVHQHVSDLLRLKYPQYADIGSGGSSSFGPVVRIDVERWSGWRFR
jgi:PPOX class probable F420-dependent enzyme